MDASTRALACAAAVALTISLLWSGTSLAQSASFMADCQKWIAQKGYSTDYIELKTGKRQPGLAGSWRGNVPVESVEPGDVALIRLRVPGAMHASFVEEIRRNAEGKMSAVRVSEWNWGKLTDQRCLVTETFGRLAPVRWVDIDTVAHVWRTSRALP
jgi:hypothetical protein